MNVPAPAPTTVSVKFVGMADSALLQDVAARIIQHYWRARKRRMPQRAPAVSLALLDPPAALERASSPLLNPSAVERLRQCREGRGLAKPPKPPRPASSTRPATSPTISDARGNAAASLPCRPGTTAGNPLASLQAGAQAAIGAKNASSRLKVLEPEDSAEHVRGREGKEATSAVATAAEMAHTAATTTAAAQAQQEGLCTSLTGSRSSNAARLVQQDDTADLRASVTTEKMANILHFLDELEAQVGYRRVWQTNAYNALPPPSH